MRSTGWLNAPAFRLAVGNSRMTIQLRNTGWRLAALFLLVGAAQLSHAQGHARNEFLLFPALSSFDTFDESDALVKRSKVIVSTNVLYSYSGDHFRFLAEYLWSSEEAELERLKVGWAFSDSTMLWLGRVHSPARYWMSEFHHGQYMQTSITRPSLESWEDDSGSTPSHITGLMLEFRQELKGEAAFEYAFSAGLAPRFVGDELHPHDLLDPDSGHGVSLNARVAYRPELFGTSSIGLIASWNQIKVPTSAVPAYPDLHRIDQLTAGFFADWQWDKLRLITSVVYYDNNVRFAQGDTHDNFVLGYAQPEYEINDAVTVFGRIDTSTGEDNSIYLRLLPGFVPHRSMLGFRWDFASFQALTMEVAETAKQGGGDSHLYFKEFRLQWSAVFP